MDNEQQARHTVALISPAAYVQGAGVLADLGTRLSTLAEKVLLISDQVVWGIAEKTIRASLEKAGVGLHFEEFRGSCTAAEIDRVAEVARRAEVDAIVGLGGGTAIDTAKAAGHQAGTKWVSAPTVASTDAPTSALAVVYTEDGAFEEYRFFPHNPGLVIVDTQLVANAPARFLQSGIGDALATWVEARACQQSGATTMAGGKAPLSAVALAKLCWDTLWEYGVQACDAARHHLVTPALEKITEANTLLSVLGFESGGLAAAHAIHNGLTALPQTHAVMHGEKVNLGTLTQLVLEGRPTAEIDSFIDFSTRIGLPTTLTEVGLGDADGEALRHVAETATAPEETIHNLPFEVSAADVIDALRAADRYAVGFRERAGLPAPAAPGSTGH
jgi:glycerol dehydrogenase